MIIARNICDQIGRYLIGIMSPAEERVNLKLCTMSIHKPESFTKCSIMFEVMWGMLHAITENVYVNNAQWIVKAVMFSEYLM